MSISILRLKISHIRTVSIVKLLLTISNNTLIIDLEDKLVPELNAYNVKRASLVRELIIRALYQNDIARVSTAKINFKILIYRGRSV